MMKLLNPEIRFETTNRCNYICTICPRDEMTRPQGTMDLELFKTLVVNGIKRGLEYVTLTSFGEPFLDKFFIDRARFVKERNLFTSVDTNGYLVNEDISQKLIDLGFDSLRFSIFATNSEVYKRLHGVDGYNRILKNIQKLLDLRKAKSAQLPRVGVYYIEQAENSEYTSEFIDFWKDKVDEISVWKAHNWINAYSFREVTRQRKKTCGRPLNGPLQIRWDGRVSACCFDFNNELIIGDVSDGNYESLFSDERYKAMQEAHRKGDMKNYSLCLKCDQLYETSDALIYSSETRNKVGTSGNTFMELR